MNFPLTLGKKVFSADVNKNALYVLSSPRWLIVLFRSSVSYIQDNSDIRWREWGSLLDTGLCLLWVVGLIIIL